MEQIIDYLKQLDLSDVEAKLYLTLLQTGPTSVRDLAQTIDIKRTTAYFYIDQLVDKGLILKLVKGSKKLVAPEDPASLENLVQEKLKNAKAVKQKFSDILKEINLTLPTAVDLEEAEIRYYKGLSGAKKMYDEALQSPELRLYVNLSELEKILFPNNVGIEYDMFEKALAKNKDLQIYEILADTPDSVGEFELEKTAQSNRYHYRFIYPNVKMTAPGILMYNNNVAIINGTKGQVVTVVLHNTDYYNNSVSLFDYVWSTIPKQPA